MDHRTPGLLMVLKYQRGVADFMLVVSRGWVGGELCNFLYVRECGMRLLKHAL
jgi:hypothetical protein